MNETPQTTLAAAPEVAAEPVATETTAATTETVAVEGAATPAAAPQQPSGFGMFVPMLLILAIFYFMMIRPQQRKEKDRRKMIEELKAGKKVIFSNGILGTIVEATEKTFKVETAPGVTMEILRACVVGVAE